MFGRKKKEEDRFIALLIEQAAKTVKGIELLESLIALTRPGSTG